MINLVVKAQRNFPEYLLKRLENKWRKHSLLKKMYPLDATQSQVWRAEMISS